MPSDKLEAPWPYGNIFPVALGPFDIGANTSGYKKYASYLAPFALTVRQAVLWVAEGTWIAGAGMVVKVEDDESSPQTIVDEYTVTTADDTGVWRPLVVPNGKVKVRADAAITCSFNSGDAAGRANAVQVVIWCEPTYAPPGRDTPEGVN